MQEPLASIDPVDWSVWADWCFDHDDIAGEARARRIAATLASGRTGLWLEYGNHLHVDLSAVHDSNPKWRYLALTPTWGNYRWMPSPEPYEVRGRKPTNPADSSGVFQTRPDLARLFFDTLAELGPFFWLPADNPTVAVPREVAVCPECGGALGANVETTREPGGVPCSVSLDCEKAHDALAECRLLHRWWQSDWQPVRDRVEHWARDHVRVKAEEDLRQEGEE